MATGWWERWWGKKPISRGQPQEYADLNEGNGSGDGAEKRG